MHGPITISRLGHLGDGIAEAPCGPVYAARTLPGEVVAGTVEGSRIAAPRILSPSPRRVRPPCPHYSGCGGCGLQHASDRFVTEWKQSVVAQALAAHGLEAPFRPPHISPPRSRRRATLAVKRTKSGALVGFYAPGSATVIDTPDCLILHPRIAAARSFLARVAARGASRKATLAAAVTCLDHGLDIAISGGKPADTALAGALAALAGEAGVTRLTWSGETLAQSARPGLSLDGILVQPPPGAFLQATAEGEAALRAAVSDATHGAARIVDLFAGLGTFALPLARRAELHAVEGDTALTGALAAGWRGADGLKQLTSETRDLFRRPLEPEELDRFDAAVIDPPRAGAEAQTSRLAASAVPRIAAISCNPVTFARDARILIQGGYRLDWVQVVDQFRWSPHVELAASFTRGHTRA